MQQDRDKRIPLIGILMHYGSASLKEQFPSPGKNYLYLPASYVQWVSQAGAIALVIPNDLPASKFQALLDKIDGFLVPGGSSELYNEEGKESSFMRCVNMAIDHCKKKLDHEGVEFPLFGICHGFQSFAVALSDRQILTFEYQNYYQSHPVLIREENFKSSRFFSKLNTEIFSKNRVYYWHGFGVNPENLKLPKYDKLREEVNFLGTSRQGENHDQIELETLLEHKKYPIFATQFHPEKAQFERGDQIRFLDRSPEFIRFSFEMALNFVEIARSGMKHDRIDPEWIKPFFSFYLTPTLTQYAGFEQTYVMPRLYDSLP